MRFGANSIGRIRLHGEATLLMAGALLIRNPRKIEALIDLFVLNLDGKKE